MTEKEEALRELLRDVVKHVEGCHDCISYTGPDELIARLTAADAWGHSEPSS